MTTPRILLLGVGNNLYTDEGLGVHAVQRLREQYAFSDNVTLLDGGTMGKMLMSDIMDCDYLVVMDAVLGGHEPGSVYRLEDEGLRKSLGFVDSQHQVDLVDTLIACEVIGNRPKAVVIGMEPADWKTLGLELTDVCQGKLDKLIAHALEEVERAGGTATRTCVGSASSLRA